MAIKASAQAGPWDQNATWGGTPPVAGDTVTITHAVSCTTDVAWSSGNLTISGGGSLTCSAGTWTISGTATFVSTAGPVQFYNLTTSSAPVGPSMNGATSALTIIGTWTPTAGTYTIGHATASMTLPAPAVTPSADLTFSFGAAGSFNLAGPFNWTKCRFSGASAGSANISVVSGVLTVNQTGGGYDFFVHCNISAGAMIVVPAGQTWAPQTNCTITGILAVYGTFTFAMAGNLSGSGVIRLYSAGHHLQGTVNCRVECFVDVKLNTAGVFMSGASTRIIPMHRGVRIQDSGSNYFIRINESSGFSSLPQMERMLA